MHAMFWDMRLISTTQTEGLEEKVEEKGPTATSWNLWLQFWSDSSFKSLCKSLMTRQFREKIGQPKHFPVEKTLDVFPEPLSRHPLPTKPCSTALSFCNFLFTCWMAYRTRLPRKVHFSDVNSAGQLPGVALSWHLLTWLQHWYVGHI